MKLARHRKARTAAITDATLSEVAKLAQIKLYYSSNSPAYVRSHTALLSVIQALAYGVYAQDTAPVRRPHQGLSPEVRRGCAAAALTDLSNWPTMRDEATFRVKTAWPRCSRAA